MIKVRCTVNCLPWIRIWSEKNRIQTRRYKKNLFRFGFFQYKIKKFIQSYRDPDSLCRVRVIFKSLFYIILYPIYIIHPLTQLLCTRLANILPLPRIVVLWGLLCPVSGSGLWKMPKENNWGKYRFWAIQDYETFVCLI